MIANAIVWLRGKRQHYDWLLGMVASGRAMGGRG